MLLLLMSLFRAGLLIYAFFCMFYQFAIVTSPCKHFRMMKLSWFWGLANWVLILDGNKMLKGSKYYQDMQILI